MKYNTLSIPTSKSYTQRALILSALSRSSTAIIDPLDCDDSYHLRNCIRELEGHVDDRDDHRWVVTPVPFSQGTYEESNSLVHCWCENGGTVLRFLSALTILLKRPLLIDGNRRLRKRPIDSLVDTLTKAGVSARFIATDRSLPLLLEKTSSLPETLYVDPSLTSQLLSGLMMACPLTGKPITIKLATKSVSKTYLAMTVHMLKLFGYHGIHFMDENTIHMTPGTYNVDEIVIEKDWSAAAAILGGLWLNTGAVNGTSLTQSLGLNPDSIQGDRAIMDFLSHMTERNSNLSTSDFEIDITHCPDIIGVLTVCALFNRYRTIIKGIHHTRIKECNRPRTLCRELSKCGAHIEEEENALVISPLSPSSSLSETSSPSGNSLEISPNLVLDPQDDHRMAMAFGLLSLKYKGIVVSGKECVSKSFSQFWKNLDRLRESARS